MQSLMLEIIRHTRFNSFNGVLIHDDLMAHKSLWDSVSLVPSDAGLFIRDLPDGTFHADTLYILTDKKRWKELRPIISLWSADRISKTNHKGTKVADRYATEDDSYKFEKNEYGPASVGTMLGMWPAGIRGKDDTRVVLSLWWD